MKINDRFSTTRDNYKNKLNNDFVNHYAGIGISSEIKAIGPFDNFEAHVPRVLYPNDFNGCDSTLANDIRLHDTFYGDDIYHYNSLGKTSYEYIRMTASRIPTRSNGVDAFSALICFPVKIASIDSNFGVNFTFYTYNSKTTDTANSSATFDYSSQATQMIKSLSTNTSTTNNGYTIFTLRMYNTNVTQRSSSDKAFNRGYLNLSFKGADIYFGIPKMTTATAPMEYMSDPMIYNYIVGGGTLLVGPY